MSIFPSQTKWIWHSAEPRNAPNQYVEFRIEVNLVARPGGAALRVSVDTDFAAWINSAFVGCGQFTDFPQQRTYSEMTVTPHLNAGRNIIAILVHYCGEDHFSYLPGDAGLWFELEVDGAIAAHSDEQARCRPSPAYQRSDTARFTSQRGFTFNYDANRADAWITPEYEADASWQPAAATTTTGVATIPQPRPTKMLRMGSRADARIVAQGLLKRDDAAPAATVAEKMQRDFLSARRSWELFDDFGPNSSPAAMPVKLNSDRVQGADGAYVVLDLGREECGFVELELDASAPCVIDIAIGEHLDDLRVRSSIGGRNFASRYAARAGQQTFADYIERYAGRYVQLHITQLTGTLELRYAGLRPAEYPVDFAGEFASSDSLHNEIWRTSRRTLHLCMFEHYEDCPWREQALYANDSRNQMLAGYYTFGNYDFARVSLDLLARSTREDDGFQELCAPMKCPITIPSFTLVWFLAMNDYLMYSGDRAFAAQSLPRMKQVLARHLATVRDDLLPCPAGKRYWQFYDWAQGLDGTEKDDCRKFATIEQARFDAPLNFFFVMALEATANLSQHAGDDAFAAECNQNAQQIKSAAQRAFWDARRQAFQTYLGRQGHEAHFAELTQSLAILAGAGNEAIRRELRAALMRPDNGMVPTTLSQSLYKFEAILLDDSAGPFVRERIADDWSRMLFAGATSFWETRNGGWDFHHAGSLCHGWSGTPAYFYGAYGLGIKPLEPGFAQVGIKPLLAFDRVDGEVPTIHGNVRLSLRMNNEGIYRAQLNAPPGVRIAFDRSRVAMGQE